MSMETPATVGERNSLPAPSERARLLRALVDELIPGAVGWPSASEAGVHGILALRLFSEDDGSQSAQLMHLLGWENGGLSSDDAETRIAAVQAFEKADPGLFDRIYTAAVLAYYETPFAVEAIRCTGRPYSHRPHVTGYAMAPFDFNRDTPRHGRGHYLKTDEVKPVDTSGLDLDTVKTEQWGLIR